MSVGPIQIVVFEFESTLSILVQLSLWFLCGTVWVHANYRLG